MNKKLKVILVAGARPNFMKIAPLITAIKKHNGSAGPDGTRIDYLLVHTDQHYDNNMSDVFFKDLEIPPPDVNLEVGSASHAVQTAKIMISFEKVCLAERPDWVLVVGDVNSTIACTLVSSKLGIKVGHVEAGLRSFDRTMPEEINRIVTDAISDILFTPSQDADKNLLGEGVPAKRIKLVGNIMIDTLIANLDKARSRSPYEKFGVKEGGYVFVTLHRPSNVDSKASLTYIMESLVELSQSLPIIFTVHPRTQKQLKSFGLWDMLNGADGLKTCEPMSYHDSLGLIDKARFILTDSGGIQEETTFLGVPCLTLRPNTERPVTVTVGTNKLTSLETLKEDVSDIINSRTNNGRIPELWDGLTGQRIIKALVDEASL